MGDRVLLFRQRTNESKQIERRELLSRSTRCHDRRDAAHLDEHELRLDRCGLRQAGACMCRRRARLDARVGRRMRRRPRYDFVFEARPSSTAAISSHLERRQRGHSQETREEYTRAAQLSERADALFSETN